VTASQTFRSWPRLTGREGAATRFYKGIPLTRTGSSYSGAHSEKITIYRRPLEPSPTFEVTSRVTTGWPVTSRSRCEGRQPCAAIEFREWSEQDGGQHEAVPEPLQPQPARFEPAQDRADRTAEDAGVVEEAAEEEEEEVEGDRKADQQRAGRPIDVSTSLALHARWAETGKSERAKSGARRRARRWRRRPRSAP
jgi:hypothetical protein